MLEKSLLVLAGTSVYVAVLPKRSWPIRAATFADSRSDVT